MKPTLWRDLRGYWSVCDGPGPLNVLGYIFQAPDQSWRVDNDEHNRRFLDQLSAASAVLNRSLPAGVHYYELKRSDELAFVVTYPEVLERLKGDGWILVSTSRSF